MPTQANLTVHFAICSAILIMEVMLISYLQEISWHDIGNVALL